MSRDRTSAPRIAAPSLTGPRLSESEVDRRLRELMDDIADLTDADRQEILRKPLDAKWELLMSVEQVRAPSAAVAARGGGCRGALSPQWSPQSSSPPPPLTALCLRLPLPRPAAQARATEAAARADLPETFAAAVDGEKLIESSAASLVERLRSAPKAWTQTFAKKGGISALARGIMHATQSKKTRYVCGAGAVVLAARSRPRPLAHSPTPARQLPLAGRCSWPSGLSRPSATTPCSAAPPCATRSSRRPS